MALVDKPNDQRQHKSNAYDSTAAWSEPGVGWDSHIIELMVTLYIYYSKKTQTPRRIDRKVVASVLSVYS